MLEFLSDGGVGYLSQRKRKGIIRIMFENWNGQGLFGHNWKVEKLNHLIKWHSIDVMAGCEAGTDWSFVEEEKQLLHLLAPNTTRKGVCAHNATLGSRISREQVGGTAVAAIGRICDVVKETGKDPTGLGRYSWVKIGDGKRTTRVVSGYLPCKPDKKKSKGRTRYEMEERYFQAKDDWRDPREIFVSDIIAQFTTWRAQGEQIILAIDANTNVYNGHLAQALAASPINMHCMMEEAMGCPVPNSHVNGKDPITTIFGTPGLVTGDGMVYPHWYGLGDHRVFILELTADSVFGGELPAIAVPTSRALNCKVSRVRQQYCKVLKALSSRHKMHEKLKDLETLDENVSAAQYQLMHNKWDNEWGDFMASAEDQCSKFKNCSIEYSPTVGMWIKRRSVLKWLLRWHDGKVPDSRNLVRAATRNGIDTPLELSRDEVEVRLVGCIGELFRLKKDAPEL